MPDDARRLTDRARNAGQTVVRAAASPAIAQVDRRADEMLRRLDDQAGATQRKLDEQAARAGETDRRLDELGARIDALAGRLDALEGRLGERLDAAVADLRRLAVDQLEASADADEVFGRALDGIRDDLSALAATRRSIPATDPAATDPAAE